MTDDEVWRQTKVVFLAAGGLFLGNILLGSVSAMMTGPISRWQILTHLHAGSVGWITLGVIDVATMMLRLLESPVEDVARERVEDGTIE